jgi:hypothetical protein
MTRTEAEPERSVYLAADIAAAEAASATGGSCTRTDVSDDQETAKTLVQAGRQVALGVASAIVCVTNRPGTWIDGSGSQRPGPTCSKR